MKTFQIAIHSGPLGAQRGATLELGGDRVVPLNIRSDELTAPLPVSFEMARECLEKLPRMFCEPDGSFVWVADDAEKSWQVDGNLVDGPAALMYVELSGRCPESQFDRLLPCFGWPTAQIVFRLIHEAIYLDNAEFRKFVFG